MQSGYVLEVLEYLTALEERIAAHGKGRHVGYMDAVFRTRKEAAEYYAMYNPHMRRLDAHKTWCSDWDPDTRLFYVVRENYGQELSVPPFNPLDKPIVTDDGHCWTYPTFRQRKNNWECSIACPVGGK